MFLFLYSLYIMKLIFVLNIGTESIRNFRGTYIYFKKCFPNGNRI